MRGNPTEVEGDDGGVAKLTGAASDPLARPTRSASVNWAKAVDSPPTVSGVKRAKAWSVCVGRAETSAGSRATRI